jgi:PLP dependent protein
MAIHTEVYTSIIEELRGKNVTLVAVSKTKPVSDILELYNLGQRDFGENYVQELSEKYLQLPQDTRWHFIGHLQSNKVKNIASFVHLVHGVDSFKLLKEINKQALKNNRVIDCLLQVHVAREETKFGFNEQELDAFVHIHSKELEELKNIHVIGLMGMASFSDNIHTVRNEFAYLKKLFIQYAQFQTPNFKLHILSMGMSGDYKTAIEEGSTMVRIGSLLFGARNYQQ